jgi:hypothetical protein
MEDNLKVIWAEFSTLSLAVLLCGTASVLTYKRPLLELKTRPRFRHVS